MKRSRVSVSFWVILTLWFLADRVAHGDAVGGAWPQAVALLSGGLVLALAHDRFWALAQEPTADTTDRTTRKVAVLVTAGLFALLVAALAAPVEIAVRSQPGDGAWALVGRSLLHPAFAFLAVSTRLPRELTALPE